MPDLLTVRQQTKALYREKLARNDLPEEILEHPIDEIPDWIRQQRRERESADE